MAQLMFALFAERVSVDRFNNSFDIHNVIEELAIPEPPAELLRQSRKNKLPFAAAWRYSLVLHWRRSNGKKSESSLTQRVQIISPDGRALATTDQEFSLRDSTYARNIVNFEGLPIVGEGMYRATVSIRSGKRWRKAGGTSFDLKYTKAVHATKARLQ